MSVSEDERHRLYLQHDFHYFVLWVFSVLEPDKDLKPEPYLLALIEAVRPLVEGRPTRLILNAPPRSLKSMIVSVALPAFLLGRRPNMKIMVCSYAETLATELHQQFQAIVRHPDCQAAFPDLVGMRTDRLDRFTTRKGGSRMALSVGGAGTGFGADLIIIDDPMKGADAGSQAKRDEVFAWYRQVVASRSNTPAAAQIVIVTQRLHADDLCGRLLDQGGWDRLSLPARFAETTTVPISAAKAHTFKTGDLLSPVQLPASYLETQARDLGTYAFSAQYLQEPVPEGGNLFKREWLRSYEKLPDRSFGEVIVSWDVGAGDGPGNDYSAVVTALVVNNTCYVVDVQRRRLRFPDLVKWVKAHADEVGARRVLIESASSGIGLIQELTDHSRLDVIPIQPKGDKVSRATAATASIEAGRVLLSAEPPSDFLKELLGFPGAKHDDMVDAFVQLVLYFRNEQGQRPDLSAWNEVSGAIDLSGFNDEID